MARRTGTVWIPKTKKAIKKLSRGTIKRVRFLIKGAKSRIKKAPSYVDRLMSRMITRRRRSS